MCYFKKKKIKMSNNLDAPNIKYVKCLKWTLNRVNYYKTLYTNLHYFNVAVGQCERHLSNSIYYCNYYHYYSGTIKHNRCFFLTVKQQLGPVMPPCGQTI